MRAIFPSELPVRLYRPLIRKRTMAAATSPPFLVEHLTGFSLLIYVESVSRARLFSTVIHREALANIHDYCAMGTSWFFENGHSTIQTCATSHLWLPFVPIPRLTDVPGRRDDTLGSVGISRADCKRRQDKAQHTILCRLANGSQRFPLRANNSTKQSARLAVYCCLSVCNLPSFL